MYYHEHDLKKLADMKAAAPEEFAAWANLDRFVARVFGLFLRLFRVLFAFAVAHTTQCPYCMEAHVKGAKKAGASKEEVAEAILLAAALRAGGAAAHGGMSMRFYDEA